MIEAVDMDRLADFVRDADEDTFKGIFGYPLGVHIFRKFCTLYNYDVVRLWNNLSPEENRAKLIEALNK